jgi:hypothetical protein
VTVTIKAIESYNHAWRRAGISGSAGASCLRRRATAWQVWPRSASRKKAVRIRRRDRLALKAEEAGQFKAASDILDAIARDVGDILDKRQTQDRFAERGAPAPATINLYGRPQPDPAPKPVGRIRKPGD